METDEVVTWVLSIIAWIIAFIVIIIATAEKIK